MDFRGTVTSQIDWSGDCLAIGFFEDQVVLSEELANLDQTLAGTLSELIEETEFKGSVGSSAVTRVGGGSAIRKIAVVGLGKEDQLTLETIRQGAAAIAKLAKKEKCKTVGVSLPIWNGDAGLTVQAMVEGMELALNQDNRFKSDPEQTKEPPIETVEFLGISGQEEAITRARQICLGVVLARELVSAPANVVTPVVLAETAEAIAQEYGLELTILEKEDCEKLGMGAYLGVAQASDMPPKFIHLVYKPSGTPRKKLAVVGKGLTFDSGGLNLKPSGSGIEMMKTDMGGAAATFGAAKAIAQLKPDVEVHFISAATENMVSGRAMHPGDILTASNGKTIEVNNTDAEGRLTLADALVFTDKLELDAIVDLATLTGACIVALGENISGMWTEDDALATQLLSAAEMAGEKFWRMPLEEKYFEGLKSVVADMKNTGPRAGGAITAALFLKQFVEKTPWVHLDVAGPVWTEKEGAYTNAGATGFAVRTLVNWILS
ncbi:MAG: leucyl aminopeptidase [Leptolyngbyaceae bacterium]|nr:leucyl aminopeptidase [Leptolyngbyaceae bacterium]